MIAGGGGGGRGGARFAAGYLVLAPLYLAPLFATRFLPALDLPHHLALADALSKAGSEASPYARLYRIDFRLAPFDGHFALLVALGSLMPLGTAAKVLVGLQVLALPLACARLLAAGGRSTVPALLAFPLGYAMPVHYGLIAFVLAVPLLIGVFAAAADEDAWRRSPRGQTAILAAALLALFFFHLEAWAVGAVAAVAAVATHRLRLRARALGLAAALPSLGALLLYAARTSPDVGRVPLLRALLEANAHELGGEGWLGRLAGRARGFPVHLLRGFTDGADVSASYVFLAMVAGMALVAWRVPRANGGHRPRLGGTVCVALAALGAYFVLPHHADPHAHSIYPRFAVVLAAVTLLAVPARLGRARPRTLDLVAAVCAAASALYAGVLWREYAAFGRELADFETVIDTLPAGHSAGGLVFAAESRVMNVVGILSGVPAYYATERAGPRTAAYLHYCGQPHLPCRMRDPAAPPALPHFTRPDAFQAGRALQDIDLILVRSGPSADVIFGAERPRVRLFSEAGTWRAFLRQ